MRVAVVLLFIVVGFGQSSEIDLRSIDHLAPKGRVQDKQYNRDLPVIDQLVSKRAEALPLLVSMLDDQTVVGDSVLDYWGEDCVGDLAHIILVDFFSDAAHEPTIPKATLLLGQRLDGVRSAADQWRELVSKRGRTYIKHHWQNLVTQYKGDFSGTKRNGVSVSSLPLETDDTASPPSNPALQRSGPGFPPVGSKW